MCDSETLRFSPSESHCQTLPTKFKICKNSIQRSSTRTLSHILPPALGDDQCFAAAVDEKVAALKRMGERLEFLCAQRCRKWSGPSHGNTRADHVNLATG